MHPLKINFICSISMFLTVNVMANTSQLYEDIRNGDSVMTPGTMVKPALGTVSKKQGNSTNYIPNQSIEYSSAPCPAGYSNNGSNSFRTGQRLVTSFYTNGQLMKTTRSDWLPVNESCTGTEDQTVSCPSGYTGTVQQRRATTYNTSGYSYGGWSDVSNSCVVIPPPPPPVVTPPVVVVPPVVVPPVVTPPVVVPPVIVPPVIVQRCPTSGIYAATLSGSLCLMNGVTGTASSGFEDRFLASVKSSWESQGWYGAYIDHFVRIDRGQRRYYFAVPAH